MCLSEERQTINQPECPVQQLVTDAVKQEPAGRGACDGMRRRVHQGPRKGLTAQG